MKCCEPIVLHLTERKTDTNEKASLNDLDITVSDSDDSDHEVEVGATLNPHYNLRARVHPPERIHSMYDSQFCYFLWKELLELPRGGRGNAFSLRGGGAGMFCYVNLHNYYRCTHILVVTCTLMYYL